MFVWLSQCVHVHVCVDVRETAHCARAYDYIHACTRACSFARVCVCLCKHVCMLSVCVYVCILSAAADGAAGKLGTAGAGVQQG